jgi:hypothetical protein
VSKKLAETAVGDFVLRWFVGIPKPMRLKVTQLTADRIICGAWEFDRRTGAEIDEDLGWGPAGVTGSFLEPESGTDSEEDFRSGALQRLAALLDAGKMQRNRGESIAEALRRRLNRMTEEQVSRMLYELESGKPS